jgi:hypothetical protein
MWLPVGDWWEQANGQMLLREKPKHNGNPLIPLALNVDDVTRYVTVTLTVKKRKICSIEFRRYLDEWKVPTARGR